MKRRILALAFALILVIALAVPAYAAQSTACYVDGTKNYLALRSQPSTNANNEIGKLYNGDYFYVTSQTSNGFAYGYTINNQYGYVNAKYLKVKSYLPQEQGEWRTVSGVKNYLAIRTTPTRNDKDEIGRLFNGQDFYVLEYRRDGFAYGRSANGIYGYVVASYLW